MRERRTSGAGEGAAAREPDRTWARAVALASSLVVVATLASVLINPLLGRIVHWNIMAVLMPVLFVGFAVLLKKRWVSRRRTRLWGRLGM